MFGWSRLSNLKHVMLDEIFNLENDIIMPQENNLLRCIQVINHSCESKNIFVKKLLA